MISLQKSNYKHPISWKGHLEPFFNYMMYSRQCGPKPNPTSLSLLVRITSR